MATAGETLQATLSETQYGCLQVLAESDALLSGRKVAGVLRVSPTTANDALATLAEAGFATSTKSGKSILWELVVSNPLISAWLEETTPTETGASPYSTGGGGVRLEHSYAACLIAAFLAGDALPELGDAVAVDSIRLQASDSSEVDDILIAGSDIHGERRHTAIAVRRNPALTKSDTTSVPLIRDFLVVVTDQWSAVSAGRWQIVLAVSTNANAINQLAELAELAQALPSADALEDRLTQPRRTNPGVRTRHGHLKSLVQQASSKLVSAQGLSAEELTWRLLFGLSVRSLRLERTDRADRAAAVTTLQRMLQNGTPAAADALFSRIEELVGVWAPNAAVLTQSVVRRHLADYPLSRSARFAGAWEVLDRLSSRLRESVRPTLRSGLQSLELARVEESSKLLQAVRSVGMSASALVVTGDPDVGKSALSLRVVEALGEDAAVCSLSLRDLPHGPMEFESQLGGFSIDDVIATAAVRPLRLLLVDGTEAVLEGKGQVFRAVAAAALRAGIAVVAVTRTDGSRQVRDELARAMELAGSGEDPAEHIVEPLTDEECRSLPETFASLSRLGSDPRARWLLGRPGLVDVLLRTGAALDPADLLCEADVFSTVWQSLIRRNEVHAPGAAAPDDREQCALAVAKRTLNLSADLSRGTAAAELRSNGVLRVPNNPALSTGDEFATDLFRDFALCRLFLTHGWEPLASAGAPRWAIRAARLGCQTALIGRDISASWTRLSTSFGEIAAEHGDRWLEIPYEALLTLGNAESALGELWGTLTENNCAGLIRLLRLAEARYVKGTQGDAFALAPLVEVFFCERREIEGGARLGHRGIREIIEDLVLAWLRGVASTRPQPNPLRQSIRDIILDSDLPLYDEFSVEALATLGPDIDDRADARLRQVAEQRPGSLASAVESVHVAVSMSQTRPTLLLDLTEAYYIKKPNPRDPWGGGHDLDYGIRHLKHGHSTGFGKPQAAWYYGPFFRLLNTSPVETIGCINRMLDHAARLRVDKQSSRHEDSDQHEEFPGAHLDLPGIGQRLYVGDSHVWAWYRGTSVGPYPCMSALLALERFVDHLHEKLAVPVQTIIELLLRDCHNLAMPGLVVGFLIRRLDAAGALLDPFLACPSVWHLESARAVGEHGFRARDPDADNLTGSDRRKHTFHEIVGAMVMNARLAGDEDRLAQLHATGNKLNETARTLTAVGTGSEEYLAMVEGWAEEFRAENYRTGRVGDQVYIYFERPERIEKVLAPSNSELQTTNELYGLQNRYGQHNDDPESWPVETLEEDLATARRIAVERPPEGMLWPENALVAVAAAAVRAHALGLTTLEASSLIWAVEAVMWAAENPQIDEMSYSGSLFAVGADRAAAAAVPLLLLSQFDALDLDRARVANCLRSLATSLYDEVRANYVKGCEPIWSAPCEINDDSGLCSRHEPAWVAATEGLIDCQRGRSSEETEVLKPNPLPTPFHKSLPTVADDHLMANRLRMPLACMIDARQVTCLQQEISDLWSPLWDAHRRGITYWWEKGYDHHVHLTHPPIAQRMIKIALSGDREPIAAHIETCATDSSALNKLFDGFRTAFTYDDELRNTLVDFWPWAMEIALDGISDRTNRRSQRQNWYDYMIAALLPTPHPNSWDPDIIGTLARCRDNWIQPEAISNLAERWLHLARREPRAIDAVIGFARSATLQWQTTTALSWIELIIDGHYNLIANRLWLLEEWLTELRISDAIMGETKIRYHRIVDGLAAAGDRGAIKLQQLDE
ncbi:hypothetical protein ACW9HC_30290 [Nocardia gipuzkoensis]